MNNSKKYLILITIVTLWFHHELSQASEQKEPKDRLLALVNGLGLSSSNTKAENLRELIKILQTPNPLLNQERSQLVEYLIENVQTVHLDKDSCQTFVSHILPQVFFTQNKDEEAAYIQELQSKLKTQQPQQINDPEDTLYQDLREFLDLKEELAKVTNKPIKDVFDWGTPSKLLFSDLPGIPPLRTQKTSWTGESPVSKVIYNLQGYTQDKNGITDIADLPEESNFFHIGKPLMLKKGEIIENAGIFKTAVEEDIPIGYNVFLPKGEIKAIVVEVYGGDLAANRIRRLKKPETTFKYFLDPYLLSQGIAYVTLDLLDLIKLQTNQRRMSVNLHEKLHGSINRFYEALRGKDPDKIFEGILPSNLKVFLFGGSFGGRTAIKHAELYPDTFDGYISHDGAIGGQLLSNYLECNNEDDMKRIAQRILLLHNYDDNRVSLSETLEFYEKAINIGKKNLITLYVSARGNPIVAGAETLKGHLEPDEAHFTEPYADQFVKFILGNSTPHETLSEWRAHQYKLYLDKNFQHANPRDKIVSDLYRLYKASFFRTGTPASSQAFQSRSAESLRLEGPPTQNAIRQDAQVRFEQFWHDIGLPYWYMLTYLPLANSTNKEINNLFEQRKLTDTVVETVLNDQIPRKLEAAGVNLNAQKLSKNKLIQTMYRNTLQQTQDEQIKLTMLKDLYRSNLRLCKDRVNELLKEPSVSNELSDIEANEIRGRLWEVIQKDQEFLKKRLQEMGRIP